MKKLLRAILSLCLIAACIFGLLSVYGGFQDVLNIQDYKTADGDQAKEGIEMARDGLAQLMENETTYTDGVKQYEDGLVQLADGRAQLADGAAQLADGEAQLADGKKQIAENTDRYNEGKALLEQIDPIMPYVQQYIQWRDSGLASAPGFSTFQEWFVSVVAPIISSVGLEIPSDVSDFPGWFNAYVEDGHAQLKQYEDGLVQIEEGEKQLAEGYAAYADGQAQLADGEKQLADGDAQLKVFEDGEGQIADGMNQLIEGMAADTRYRSGEVITKSLAERLGPDWQLYVLNEDGSRKQYRGVDFVNFENCVKLCDEGEKFLEESEANITAEMMKRIATMACMGIASVLGLIAGILGLIAAFSNKRKNGFGFGLWGTIISCAGIIVGLLSHWRDQAYQIRDAAGNYTYTYDAQVKAIIILACVLALFTLVSAIARKNAPKKVKGASKSADQIYASAVSDHSKDAEIARLREELADLRAKKPDTYKE